MLPVGACNSVCTVYYCVLRDHCYIVHTCIHVYMAGYRMHMSAACMNVIHALVLLL